jgi:hypothetical protein
MRKRRPNSVRVDQRDNPTDACNAYPDRNVFGPVWHEEANDITFREAFECPTAVAVSFLRQLREG